MIVQRLLLTICCLANIQGLVHVAQSVTYQTTDAYLTAVPGVARLIMAWSSTSLYIDHEIISTVILHWSADLFKKSCQLQAKLCARSTG